MGTNNLQNDPRELLRLAKSGDTDAYGQLYELYFTPIFRYIYFRVKDKEETNDLIQIVFLKVFSALPGFKEQQKSPLAYFFTVARNTIIDHWRSKKEVKIDNFEVVAEKMTDNSKNPLKIFEEKENQNLIHCAMQQLTNIQQEVITLKFINDLTNKEIAELLEKTEEAVRQLQSRAIKSLRIILKNQKYYE